MIDKIEINYIKIFLYVLEKKYDSKLQVTFNN